MKFLLRVTAFALLLLPLFLGVRADDSGLEMHRLQAQEQMSSGWHLARSTNGNFSVLLPLPFNDFTVHGLPADSVTKTEAIGTKSSEGIKFMASRLTYSKSGLSQRYFSKFMEKSTLPLASRKQMTVGKFPAIHLEMTNGTSASHQRAVLVGDDLMLLAVEWPVEQNELAHELLDTFFDSLIIYD